VMFPASHEQMGALVAAHWLTLVCSMIAVWVFGLNARLIVDAATGMRHILNMQLQSTSCRLPR
jgi:hypothetical protein